MVRIMNISYNKNINLTWNLIKVELTRTYLLGSSSLQNLPQTVRTREECQKLDLIRRNESFKNWGPNSRPALQYQLNSNPIHFTFPTCRTFSLSRLFGEVKWKRNQPFRWAKHAGSSVIFATAGTPKSSWNRLHTSWKKICMELWTRLLIHDCQM